MLGRHGAQKARSNRVCVVVRKGRQGESRRQRAREAGSSAQKEGKAEERQKEGGRGQAGGRRVVCRQEGHGGSRRKARVVVVEGECCRKAGKGR